MNIPFLKGNTCALNARRSASCVGLNGWFKMYFSLAEAGPLRWTYYRAWAKVKVGARFGSKCNRLDEEDEL